MGKNKVRWVFASLIVSTLMKSVVPGPVAGSNPGTPSVRYGNTDHAVEAKIEAILPRGLEMVDGAIAMLSGDLANMSPAQQALLAKFFDPAGTGEIDEAFVRAVLENYRTIRREFEDGLIVEYEIQNSQCAGMRLYYTDFFKVHVCPYIHTETDADRMARDFVHELAHIAFVAVDRAYYSPTSTKYAELTPHGHWTSHIPLVGRIFREITHSDTLYHPDAYSEFAFALSVLEAGNADTSVVAGTEIDVEAIAEAGSADRKFTR